METILLVEDEASILRGLEKNLRYEGYNVITAVDGERGLELAVNRTPDLIVLDIMLPEVNGYEICRILRKRGFTVPIIMLTAKSQEMDKVLGFELGADDYVTKPFSTRELMARINAMLRRRRLLLDEEESYSFGGYELDIRGKALYYRDRELPLSKKEFDLLHFFLRNPGRAMGREDLLNHVWGYDYYGTPRTVDNFINKLRQKIEDDVQNPEFIVTVRGVGYKFVNPYADSESESESDNDEDSIVEKEY